MTCRSWLLAGWLVLLTGCATPPPAPPEPEPPALIVEEKKIESQPLKYLVGRHLKPQPTRPLNVKSRCAHRDAIGTRTNLQLLVKDALVKDFSAQIAMKGHGICRFNLKDFEQTEKLPQALLRHKQDRDCLVRMWEEGPKVTIAFNSCPKACEGDAFSYLWPIMVEAKSGRCF